MKEKEEGIVKYEIFEDHDEIILEDRHIILFNVKDETLEDSPKPSTLEVAELGSSHNDSGSGHDDSPEPSTLEMVSDDVPFFCKHCGKIITSYLAHFTNNGCHKMMHEEQIVQQPSVESPPPPSHGLKYATESISRNKCNYKCGTCHICFTNHYAYMHHRKTHTGQRQLHECEDCGVMYSREYDLNKHLKFIHGKLKKILCDCGMYDIFIFLFNILYKIISFRSTFFEKKALCQTY